MTHTIGLFYGSSTSHTEYIAYELQEIINNLKVNSVDVYNIGQTKAEQIKQYDYLIFGIPTWDIGELQADWDVFWATLEQLDLSGKKVAVFGLGDQYSYTDTFQDAMGILAEEVLERGAELMGYTSIEGYEFEDSIALSIDRDEFMGLSLDEDHQSDLTAERLNHWAQQVLSEFGLLMEASIA
ncbi:MAG: flavodoxin FldB [Crocinitomicaceae bacterium]